MVALVVLAIVIFGPDKLPKMVGEAARTIRRFREFSNNARSDLKKELGPEFQDLKLEDLNPKTFVRKNLLGDDDLGIRELKTDLTKQLAFDDDLPAQRSGDPQVGAQRPRSGQMRPGERPPFDADAT
jgi:sec-independent protein translocase protein TatB